MNSQWPGRVFAAALMVLGLPLGIAVPAGAEDDPPGNNPVGINVARLSQERFVGAVGGLVNTNGGDWGYMTITWTQEDRDSSLADWILQQFLDRCFEYHLNPIIRVGTWHHGNEVWERPAWDEPNKWREFFERGRWGSSPVYVIVGNEPNLGFEWGGEVDPEGYAKYLAHFIDVFADSERFRIVNAPLDASNWTEYPRMLDEIEYIEGMRAAVPDIFERLAAWASNPYRVPSAGEMTRYTHLAYEAELEAIGRDMPVIITESGLMETADDWATAEFFEKAFRDWLADPRVLAATPLFWNPHTNHYWMFRPNADGTVSIASETYRRISQLPKPAGSPNYRPTLGNVPRGGTSAAAAASGPAGAAAAATATPRPPTSTANVEPTATPIPEPTATPQPEPTATPLAQPTATTPATPTPRATSTPVRAATPTPAPEDPSTQVAPTPTARAIDPPAVFPTSTPAAPLPTNTPITAAAAVYIPPVPPTALALPAAVPAASAAGTRFRIGNTDGAGANLRADPESTSAKVASLDDGDVVQAVGEEADGGGRRWRRVRTADGALGWIVVEALVPLE